MDCRPFSGVYRLDSGVLCPALDAVAEDSLTSDEIVPSIEEEDSAASCRSEQELNSIS